MKYTPGPWKQGYKDNQVVYGSDSLRVTVLECARDKVNTGHWLANARLIAAAPELLEALRAMLAHTEPNAETSSESVWNVARRAIAKATGGK